MVYYCAHPDHQDNKCKQALYNFKDNPALYCSLHKEEGMINIKSKKCAYKKDGGCSKRPSFNFKGKKPLYCFPHKEEGMIDVLTKKCAYEKDDGCIKQAIYNFEGKKPLYCIFHQEDGMRNVKSKTCNSSFCSTIANKYYSNFCCYCFTNLFPNDPKTKSARKKNKEIAVKNYLYENGHSDFLHDKPIFLGDCNSSRRVDLYKYVGEKHILCVEVDEGQHKYYNHEDEEQRYHDLYRVGYTMIFIRFNPDKFKDEKGKNRNPYFETRMHVLLKKIKQIQREIGRKKYEDELLYITRLYYDKL